MPCASLNLPTQVLYDNCQLSTIIIMGLSATYLLKLTVANSNEDFQMEGHIASAIRGDGLIIRSAQ